MSEDVWEQSVALWLTRDRGVFVSPSFHLGDDGKWACIDLLALDFPARTVWAIEVTTGPAAENIRKKAEEFDASYAPKIREALAVRDPTLGDLTGGWQVGLWAFVREESVPKLAADLLRDVGTSKVTALQDVAFPWLFWDDRFR